MKTNTDRDQQRMEDRRIITPYAFHIAPELLGIKLATRWRRAAAIAVDLMLVALLSTLNGYLMATLVGVILWRMAGDLPIAALTKVLLRALAVMVTLFALTAGIATQFTPSATDTDTISPRKGIELAIAMARAATCQDLPCWQPHVEAVAELVSQQAQDRAAAHALIEELLAESALSVQDRSHVSTQIFEHTRFAGPGVLQDNASTRPATNTAAAPSAETPPAPAKPVVITAAVNGDTEKASGPLAWLRGVIEELGLGFGWGACYFTLFTAWWNGQTPGKRLLRIQVLQLDNTPISLWDAFGRYGGYGAGLATGLLGFIQILWDPNRQAIQDKIATTVVIMRQQNGPQPAAAAGLPEEQLPQ